ncbi:MAG: AsmA family protein, partial [Pseudorhodoplanes sp.]
MQTTLLGLAIALILALLAALVGPFFVDWNDYRPRFEAEASRLVGLPVRVGGAIDVRILPNPTLVLNGVEIGPRGEDALRAHSLGIEFALGS